MYLGQITNILRLICLHQYRIIIIIIIKLNGKVSRLVDKLTLNSLTLNSDKMSYKTSAYINLV